ncbi:MAG: hypothetical protein GWN55_06885 [Phycisphaerae bacterium]|nr:hypothetical protein [Phycisphaerae bacterium]NIU25706.1 hypothetical protein [candidate division KSB1 bacterium]NIP55091.1 hypothetical protein [Phycisphaerae bacterium]NIS52699.1 hypothetical protein [Phycisphaerae bacterium]NIV01035.1 hypothetical protein [Phycisphaerae bacterium]
MIDHTKRATELWDSLRGRALHYYGTLHDARYAAQDISDPSGSAVDYETLFNNLTKEHGVLKRHFKYMLRISRTIPVSGNLGHPPQMLSVEVQDVADLVFGPNEFSDPTGLGV